MNDDGLLDEQVRYYRERAAEYDQVYERRGRFDHGPERNAGWLGQLARVEAAFDALELVGDVVELAAGTGHWTERIAARARSLTVVDAAPEMLERNRSRLGARARSVHFVVADLFDWRPARVWDACVVCFFLSHVPDARLHDVVGTIVASLRPGGLVFFADRTGREDTRAESVERRLDDGRIFRVVEHGRSPAALVQVFAHHAMRVEVTVAGEALCYGIGRRAR